MGGVADQVLLDLDPATAEAGDPEEDHRPREETERLEVEIDVIGLVVELGREKDVGVGAAPAVGAEPRDAGRVAAVEGLERHAGRGGEPPVPDEVVERTVTAPGQARLEGRADPVDQAKVAVQEPEGRLGARPGTRRRFGRGDDPGTTERTVRPLSRDGLLHGDAVVLGEEVSEKGPGTAVLAREDVAVDEARPEDVVVLDDGVLTVPVDRLPEPRRDPPERYAHHRS